jgi:hypothetical protein
MSPADNLLHEAGHAFDFTGDKGRFYNEWSHSESAGLYYDLEDERVMTGIEANALIIQGLSPRTSHQAGTSCVTSLLSNSCPP